MFGTNPEILQNERSFWNFFLFYLLFNHYTVLCVDMINNGRVKHHTLRSTCKLALNNAMHQDNMYTYTVVKVDGATAKRWRFERSCAIYFPGGISDRFW